MRRNLILQSNKTYNKYYPVALPIQMDENKMKQIEKNKIN